MFFFFLFSLTLCMKQFCSCKRVQIQSWYDFYFDNDSNWVLCHKRKISLVYIYNNFLYFYLFKCQSAVTQIPKCECVGEVCYGLLLDFILFPFFSFFTFFSHCFKRRFGGYNVKSLYKLGARIVNVISAFIYCNLSCFCIIF